MIVVIDQRDIQRKGGLCAKYPSSYVVCELLKRFGIKRVLDVTFGRGRFYKLCRRDVELLVASDPAKWPWLTVPDAFYQATVWQLYNAIKAGSLSIDSIDCVVVDPPRWSGAEYKRRGEYNFLIGSPRLIIEYATKVARIVGSTYMLLHFNKVVSVDGWVPAYIVEFKWFARYLNSENKNISYYIIYNSNTHS